MDAPSSGHPTTVRLLRLPGVYGPAPDSLLLAQEVPAHVRAGDRVLDVFTGSGVLAVTAASAGAAEVCAVDVSRRAILAVAINARLNGVAVEAFRGSMFGPLAGRRFDLIVANPPYVPSAGERPAPRGAARAWDAGPDGRRLLDPFLEQLPHHLSPAGRVLLVQSSISSIDRTLAALDAAGLVAEVIACEEAPLGPITATRAPELERWGMLRAGQRTEQTTVIAAFARTPAPSRAEPAPVAVAVG